MRAGSLLPENLRTRIPEDEKGLGFVWRQGLGGHRDSLGVYLPGYSKMNASSSRPKGGVAGYAREAFRVMELPYLRNWMITNPEQAANTALAHAYELGVLLFPI